MDLSFLKNYHHFKNLIHFLFALFIPAGWSIILYPYCRAHRKDWKRMLVYAVFLSAGVIFIKEMLDLPEKLTLNDVVADMLGLFFGLAFVALVFVIKGKAFAKKVHIFDRDVSISNILAVANKLELQASYFYNNTAGYILDPKAKKLCLQMAAEEKRHAAIIDLIMERWLPPLPDNELKDWVDRLMVEFNMFIFDFPVERASPVEILNYAVMQEKKTQDIYRSFRDAFPGWKDRYIQMLIDSETGHIEKIEHMLSLIGDVSLPREASADDLIGMLKKSRKNEDEFVVSYGTDFLHELDGLDGITLNEKAEIRSILTVMLEDTIRHGKVIDDMIKSVGGTAA